LVICDWRRKLNDKTLQTIRCPDVSSERPVRDQQVCRIPRHPLSHYAGTSGAVWFGLVWFASRRIAAIDIPPITINPAPANYI
jgi:hypothetical protein